MHIYQFLIVVGRQVGGGARRRPFRAASAFPWPGLGASLGLCSALICDSGIRQLFGVAPRQSRRGMEPAGAVNRKTATRRWTLQGDQLLTTEAGEVTSHLQARGLGGGGVGAGRLGGRA
jgi:hypothetical protein